MNNLGIILGLWLEKLENIEARKQASHFYKEEEYTSSIVGTKHFPKIFLVVSLF